MKQYIHNIFAEIYTTHRFYIVRLHIQTVCSLLTWTHSIFYSVFSFVYVFIGRNHTEGEALWSCHTWENVLPQVIVLSGHDLHHLPTLKNNFLPVFKVLLQNWTSISFLYFFPSWCSSSRQRMRWIIFWRLVPGRREIFGQLTSPLRSTSCGRPTAGSWQTSKTLLDPGYTTSIWGKPRKQKFTRRLCSIARNLVVFPLPHPADSLLLSLLVFTSLSYFFVSFKAKCWTPCMTSTAVSRWATMWSRAALTATVSQVRLYIFILLHHLRLCLLRNI